MNHPVRQLRACLDLVILVIMFLVKMSASRQVIVKIRRNLSCFPCPTAQPKPTQSGTVPSVDANQPARLGPTGLIPLVKE